ncbi:MAG: hypothetical protein B6229_05405 [Spirochaetaceae bacterium 4572_7]|nr:MAG: hypothetical protein B6229_05405 [Spirochaetaceae bacterium 4572_7]
MIKKTILLTLPMIILSCQTPKHISSIESTPTPSLEILSQEISVMPDELATDSLLEEYDLTVLKGGSYPEIKNDTPFSEIELKILQNSDGLEFKASVEIAHYFKYFLRDRRDLLELWIRNARPILPSVKSEFNKKGFPEDLIYLPFLESGYNVMAYSRMGAGGIWQFIPKTAKSYGLNINWWVDERRNPHLATQYAIKHLDHLYKRFDSWYTALAAYNAGEGRIDRAMKRSGIYDYFELIKTDELPMETRKYVIQYLAIVKIMKNLGDLGFEEFNWDLPVKIETVKIPGGTDLYALATTSGITWKEFRNLNPSFRRMVSDPSRYSNIYVPVEKLSEVDIYLTKIKPITATGYRYYTIRSGDSWWYLSKLTGNSITSLKHLNNIGTNNLKIGQRILLPNITLPSNSRIAKTSPNSGNLQTYVVKSGDTISRISVVYNIKLDSLYGENNLNSHSILHVGQILKLPGYFTTTKKEKNSSHDDLYRVESGDSIWIIAQKMNIPYKNLLEINNFTSRSKLQIGDLIRLY